LDATKAAAMNTVRLRTETQERLNRLASRLGVTVSEIHRAALEEYLARAESADSDAASAGTKVSRWDAIIGVVGGDPDGSMRAGEHYRDHVVKKHSKC
jgi:predicted DNA-binding protein